MVKITEYTLVRALLFALHTNQFEEAKDQLLELENKYSMSSSGLIELINNSGDPLVQKFAQELSVRESFLEALNKTQDAFYDSRNELYKLSLEPVYETLNQSVEDWCVENPDSIKALYEQDLRGLAPINMLLDCPTALKRVLSLHPDSLEESREEAKRFFFKQGRPQDAAGLIGLGFI